MKRTKDVSVREEPRVAGYRELLPVRDGKPGKGVALADVLGRFTTG